MRAVSRPYQRAGVNLGNLKSLLSTLIGPNLNTYTLKYPARNMARACSVISYLRALRHQNVTQRTREWTFGGKETLCHGYHERERERERGNLQPEERTNERSPGRKQTAIENDGRPLPESEWHTPFKPILSRNRS